MNAPRADRSKPLRLRAVVASWLLLMLSMPAFALGLGQIQVKSRPGQPLLAEIPIISSDPTELQGLQARLASPETFRRVGLEPPQGIVSDLQFTPAVDEAGRPVIRVTSSTPVQQAALTFLLEVDWGQGRLVREYSALVDAPRTVAAPIEPAVEAPTAAPAPVIQRPQAAEPASEPTPAPPPAAVAATPVPAPVAPTPAPPPSPAPAPAAQAEATPQARAAASGYGPVKRGETLSAIAGGMTGEYSLDQTMLALLRANPEAFIGQDINRLREGAVLRAPGEDELSRYSASQAASMVREQIASWRQARRAQLQPAAAAATTEASARTANTKAPAAGRRVADARLEIAPPQSSAGKRAGTQSGASAGGEGEMLRQELQQTKETLAARDAEVQELKTRVAELEQLQKEQQQLISMKDSALANAQQRLASTNAAQQATPAQAQASPAQGDGGSAWWWLLPLALLLGALGWWFARRRTPAAPRPATGRVSESFASVDSGTRRDDEAAPAADADQTVPASTPQWVGKAKASAPTPPADEQVAVGEAPAWVTAGEHDAAQSVALNQAPAGRDRIELARAYAQLGDRNTARSLLQEVIDGGDAKAREEAARALQMLS